MATYRAHAVRTMIQVTAFTFEFEEGEYADLAKAADEAFESELASGMLAWEDDLIVDPLLTGDIEKIDG